MHDQDIRFAFQKNTKPKRAVIIESDEEEVIAEVKKVVVDPMDFFNSKASTPKPALVSKSKESSVTAKPSPTSKENLIPQKRSNEFEAASASKIVKQATIPAIKSPVKEDEPKQKLNYFQLKAQKEAHQVTVTRPAPVGTPDCLAGKTFVFTGDLNSITREQATDYVKRYGGRVTGAPSKKTTFVIVGENPGPSKMVKIQDLGINTLDEDGFYALINNSLSNRPAVAQNAIPVTNHTKSLKTEVDSLKNTSGSMPTVESIPVKKGKGKLHSETVPIPKGKEKSVHSTQLWTDKYKPAKFEDIIGNKSNVDKLSAWLSSWQANKKAGFPKGDSSYRATMLSGPPGIGKTTAAHLVSSLLGFEVIEFNASDTRSKKSLQNVVTETTHSNSIMNLFGPKDQAKKKKVLIMDEVDGMSAGDRGGSAELIKIIKNTGIPIICICNDRSSPKIRTLANYCLDLRFRRPTVQQIEKMIQSVARREGFKIESNAIGELVQSTSGDIRQILNILSGYARDSSSMNYDESKELSILIIRAKSSLKNIALTPFDITGKLFGQSTFRAASMEEKIDWYFHDYSLIPLMVQENYIKMKPSLTQGSGLSGKVLEGENMKLIANAADSISTGDLLDSIQRKYILVNSENSWSLLPLHAVLSTVVPCFMTHGSMQGQYMFSGWLGQYSKSSKGRRLLRELQQRLRLKITGNKQEVRLDYIPLMVQTLLKFLNKDCAEGAIKFLDEYYLTKEDFDSLMELGYQDAFKEVPTKTKTAFTRLYNSTSHLSPFDLSGGNFKRTKDVKSGDPIPDSEDILLEDEIIAESESEGEVAPAIPIKAAKKAPTKKATAKKGSSSKK